MSSAKLLDGNCCSEEIGPKHLNAFRTKLFNKINIYVFDNIINCTCLDVI